MKLQIRKIQSVAPEGPLRLRYISAAVTNKKNTKGIEYPELMTTLRSVDVFDRQGNPYEFRNKYNLEGHGPKDFEQDYLDAFGRSLTPEELEEFDTDALLIGKDVIGHSVRRKEGKHFIAEIEKFEQVAADVLVAVPTQS